MHLIAVITIRLRDTRWTQPSDHRSVSVDINDQKHDAEGRVNDIGVGIQYFVLMFILTVSIQIESILLIIGCVSGLAGNGDILDILNDVFLPILIPIECMIKS